MRHIIIPMLAALTACASTQESMTSGTAAPIDAQPATPTSNALLAEWSGPFGGVPPFDKVAPSLFPQAFQAAIDARRAEILAISNNPEAPTFQNTFMPLQNAGRTLNRVGTLFSVMNSNVSTPEYQALDREWSPKLAAANDEIVFNDKLFHRIETIYNNRNIASLTPEQKRLVERTYQ